MNGYAKIVPGDSDHEKKGLITSFNILEPDKLRQQSRPGSSTTGTTKGLNVLTGIGSDHDNFSEQHIEDDMDDNHNVDDRSTYASNFAQFKQDQKRGNKNAGDIEKDKKEFLKMLLQDQRSHHQKRFPFERSQFHQCIPHPDADNCFITVQIVNSQLTLQGPHDFKKNLSMKYQEYEIKTFEIDSGTTDQEMEKQEEPAIIEIVPINTECNFAGVSSWTDAHYMGTTEQKKIVLDKLYTPSALAEDVDAINGIKSTPYAQLSLNEDSHEIKAEEIAIIGLWKLSKNVFRCTETIEVPNPMKREIQNVKGTILQQVLYTSEKEIFYFNKDVEERNNRLLLHRLSSTLEKREEVVEGGSILEKYITTMNNLPLDQQRQLPNPKLIKKDGQDLVVFTTYQMHNKASTETEESDEEAYNKVQDCQYPNIIFYDVAQDKVQWEILGADVFIDFHTNREIMYLTHDKYKDEKWVKANAKNKGNDNKKGIQKGKSEGKIFINVVDWGKSPTKIALEGKEEAAPVLQNSTSYRLFFGENKGLMLADSSKLVEAHIHNREDQRKKRVTLVYRGFGAFTFTLENKKSLTESSRYTVKLKPKKQEKKSSNDYNLSLEFDENLESFKGDGVDQNNQKVKIKQGTVTPQPLSKFEGFYVRDNKQHDLVLENIEIENGEISVKDGKGYDKKQKFYYRIQDGKINVDEDKLKSNFKFTLAIWKDQEEKANQSQSDTENEEPTYWADKAAKIAGTYGQTKVQASGGKCKDTFKKLCKEIEDNQTRIRNTIKTNNTWTYEGVCNRQTGTFKGEWERKNDGKVTEKGPFEFKIATPKNVTFKLKINGAKLGKKMIEAKLDCSTMTMYDGETDDYDITIQSIEHVDNSQLTYFLQSRAVEFVCYEQNAYVCTELMCCPDENETQTHGDAYVKTEIRLYNVSENVSEKEKTQCLEQKRNQTVKFLLNQSFMVTQQNQSRQLWSLMPIHINKDNQFVGSVVYSQFGTDDMILEFFTSKFSKKPECPFVEKMKGTPKEKECLDYSQQSLPQEWIIEYPILAYKHYSPENHKLCIINLAKDAPQKIINLGDWEFVNFVNHTQMVEKRIFDKQQEVHSHVMFLATYSGKTRLLSYKCEPWLNEEELSNDDDLLNQLHSLIIFNGVLDEKKDDETKAGQADYNRRRFDSDKLKNVQLLTKNYSYFKQFQLIMQFNHTIQSTSLCKSSQDSWKSLCGKTTMIKLDMVRGHNNQIYYAETSGNADKVRQLELHETNKGEMVIKEVYQLSGSHIIAFEADHENIQDDSPGNEIKQAFYIMDDNQKIFLITNEDGTQFNVEKTFNFAIHNKLRQVQNLQQQMWSNIHISPRTVTFDGCSYNLETKLSSKIKLPKMYVGRDKTEHDHTVNTCLKDHVLKDCDEVEVYKIIGNEKEGQVKKRQQDAENKPKTFKLMKCVVCSRSNGVKKYCSEPTCKQTNGDLYVIHEEKCKEDKHGKWNVLSQHNMPMNTGLIAVGQRNNKHYCFALQPSPGSRKLDLVSSAQIPDIQDMIFVSNDHVLVNRSLGQDDRSEQFIHFATNGTVLYQKDDEIKEIYNEGDDLQLICQSELCDRKKYLTYTRDASDLLVLKYNELGQAKLEGKISKHRRILSQKLNFLKKWELYEANEMIMKKNDYKRPEVLEDQEEQEWEKKEFPGQIEKLGDTFNIIRNKTWLSEKDCIMGLGKKKYKNHIAYKELLSEETMRKIDKLIEQQAKHDEKQKKDGLVEDLKEEEYFNQDQEDWNTLDKIRQNAKLNSDRFLAFTGDVTDSIIKHACVRVGGEGEMIYYASMYTPTRQAPERKISEIPYRVIDLPNEIADSKFTFKVIVFECLHNEEWKKIKSGTDFEIIGDYLVHRHGKETELSVKKLDFGENKLNPSPKPVQRDESILDKTIQLEELIGNEKCDILTQDHLRIYPVPNSSHLQIQMRQPGQKDLALYDNLLQVSFRDKSIIYNLDQKGAIQPQEVTFLSKMGQFIKPDAFTNTGFTVNISQDTKEDDDGNTIVSREILIPNEYNNLLFSKQQQIKLGKITKRSSSGLLYQTFSEIDIEQLKVIRKAVEEGTKIPEIDEDTIICTFEGSTIFSIYCEDIRVYEQIQNQLSAREFEDEEDLLGQPIENSYLRRLIQILKTPSRSLKGKYTSKLKDDQSAFKVFWSRQFGEPFNSIIDAIGFQPIMNKSIHFMNPHFRDLLMQITMLSKENTLDMFVENLEDMSLLIEQKSIAVTNFFGDCFLRTDYCDNIHNAEWEANKKICVFRQNTSILTEDTANEGINPGKASGRQNKMIELEMLKIDWIFQKDRNGKEQGQGDLVKTLSKSSNRAIFSTKLVTTLVEIFEEDYFWKVMNRCFIPFCVYFMSTIYYFSNNLIDTTFRASLIESERGYFDNLFSLDFLNQFITIIGMIYFLGIEIAQMWQNRLGYLTDWWNYADLLSIILNTILLIDLFNYQLIDIETTRVIAFVAVFILWWKLIYWFRLFTPTAFYIKLIFETIKNAIFFLLIFVAVVVAFANAIYILNKNRISPDYTCDERQNTGLCGDLLFEEATGSDAVDSLLNQYQLSLGEFGTNNFSLDDSANSWIIWGLFVAATFLSQITILNMLITIMGDTYENMISNRDEIGVQYKIQLFADFTFFITTKHVSEEKKFIFAASPKNKADVDSSWEGKVAGIKRHNIALVEGQTKFLVSKMENVLLKIDQSTAKTSSLEDNIERRIEMNRSDIQTKLDVVLQKIAEIQSTVIANGESEDKPSKQDKIQSIHNQDKPAPVQESLQLEGRHSLNFEAKTNALVDVLKE